MGSMAFNETMMETRERERERERERRRGASLFIPLFSSLMRLLFSRVDRTTEPTCKPYASPRTFALAGTWRGNTFRIYAVDKRKDDRKVDKWFSCHRMTWLFFFLSPWLRI